MIDSHALLEDDSCSYDNEKREEKLLNVVAGEPNELPRLALAPSEKMKLYCCCRSLWIRQTTAASVAAGLGGYSSPLIVSWGWWVFSVGLCERHGGSVCFLCLWFDLGV